MLQVSYSFFNKIGPSMFNPQTSILHFVIDF
jgi:hypothetical protein